MTGTALEYQPWIHTNEDGSQTLVQIFIDTESGVNDTGLIKAVQLARRSDPHASWGPPLWFARA